jgi:hypothetical protein
MQEINMGYLMALIGLIGFVVFLFFLDRIGLWLEVRGILYYRKREKKPSSTLGNVFLEVHSLFEGDKKYLLEAKRSVKEEKSIAGEPPFEDLESTIQREIQRREKEKN